MAPPHQAEKIQKEGRTSLAISAIQKKQFPSERRTATVLDVTRSTLQNRRKGIQPRLGSRSKCRLLWEHEEEVLVSWIHNMEQRGYPLHIIDVQRMAQTLLTRRGTSTSPPIIGKNWVYRWIKQHPDVDARLSRSLDSQRAKNKDPKIINQWFERVQNIRQEYGILDNDTYNFDETGFAIGIATPRSLK